MPKTQPIPIPAPKSPIPKSAIEATADHPEFSQMAQWYRFLRESHELSGGYAPVTDSYQLPKDPVTLLTSYLVPHEREDITGFQRRVRNSRPPQFMSEGIAITTGVLTYQQPRRDKHPEKLEEWLKWVSPTGQDWRGFVATDVVPMLERYGWTSVFFAPPPVSGVTEAQAKAAREEAGLPELVARVITPEQIRAWALDDNGQYVWLRFVESVYSDTGPTDGGMRRIRRHWWITRSGWWYVDDDVNTADKEMISPVRDDPQRIDESVPQQGDQARAAYAGKSKSAERRDKILVKASGYWRTDKAELSRVPLAIWELTNRISPSHACALAQLDYYRTESELRNLEAQTAFSQLWIPTSSNNTDPRNVIRGGGVIGSFPFDSRHVPMILSPDAGPFEHFMTRLNDLRNEAYGAWGLRQDLGGAGTGLALSLIQERSTNLYRQHSDALTQGDVRSMEIAAEMLQEELDDDFVAEYPTDFSSLTATSIVENGEKFLANDVGDVFKIESIVEQARAIMPHLTDDQLQEGRAALEKRIKEEEDMAAEMRDKTLMAMDEKGKPGKPGKPGDEGSPPALDAKRARGQGGQERLQGKKG